MKKIFAMAMAALLGVATTGQAQRIDLEPYQKREAKSNASIANPKKQKLASTWLDRGKLYLDAATAPVPLFRNEMPQKEMELMMNKDKVTKANEVIDKVRYNRWKYSYITVYLLENKLKFWVIDKEVLPDALAKSFEAYAKAYELDNKAKVKDGLERLANHYKQDGYNLVLARKYSEAADAFAKAYDVLRFPAIGEIDTLSLFNAGHIYMLNDNFQNGAKCLEQALKYGYESKGEIYWMLHYCYKGMEQMDKGKEILFAGLAKHPDNTEIVGRLMEHYASTGEDPKDIIPIVKSMAENNADNPNLWFGLGRLCDQIGDLDGSIEAFAKAAELLPKDFASQFNCGLLYIKKAELKLKELSEIWRTLSQKVLDEEILKANQTFEQAVAPLEKALALAPDPKKDPNGQYKSTLDYLRMITKRLSDNKFEGMKEKNERFEELYKALPE